MIIEEGSILKIIDLGTDYTMTDEIIVNEDVVLENENGNGYTILLRASGHDANSIFEADKIIKEEENVYTVYGYFKDALLVILEGKFDSKMYKSYMDYDN